MISQATAVPSFLAGLTPPDTNTSVNSSLSGSVDEDLQGRCLSNSVGGHHYCCHTRAMEGLAHECSDTQASLARIHQVAGQALQALSQQVTKKSLEQVWVLEGQGFGQYARFVPKAMLRKDGVLSHLNEKQAVTHSSLSEFIGWISRREGTSDIPDRLSKELRDLLPHWKAFCSGLNEKENSGQSKTNRRKKPNKSKRVHAPFGLAAGATRGKDFPLIHAFLKGHKFGPGKTEKVLKLLGRFVNSRAQNTTDYLTSILEQGQQHQIGRFNGLLQEHANLVKREARFTERLKAKLSEGARSQVEKRLDAICTSLDKRASFAFNEAHFKGIKRSKQRSDSDQLDLSLWQLYRKDNIMAKHEGKRSEIVIPDRQDRTTGRNLCARGTNRAIEKLASFDVAQTGKSVLVDQKSSFALRFGLLEEAHRLPFSKILCFQMLRAAGDTLNIPIDKQGDWASELQDLVKHEWLHHEGAKQQLDTIIEGILSDIDQKSSPEKVDHALFKLLSLAEYVSLLEASLTDHLPSDINQETDHYAESKLQKGGKQTTSTATQLLLNLNQLRRNAAADSHVDSKTAADVHSAYLSEVEAVTLKALHEELAKAEDPDKGLKLRAKSVMRVVGAMDQLAAVRAVQNRPTQGSDFDEVSKRVEAVLHKISQEGAPRDESSLVEQPVANSWQGT